MTRAVGYLRVSTARQAEEGMGLAVQRDLVVEYARRRRLELAEVVEEAASGGVREGEEFSWEHRPVLLRLIDRAKEGEFSTLIVAKLDRLSRDYPTLIVCERRFQRLGVEVISASEENGDGPLAEFVRGQLALVAQLERAMILERARAGKAKKKALGRHVHGRVPYGYRSRKGILEPAEELASIVRSIFTWANAGDSPGRIARRLNELNVPAPRADQWGRSTIRAMLANTVYCGERYGVKRAHQEIVSRRAWNKVNAETAARDLTRASSEPSRI